jgi:glycosyltransferase involved in cell wall biosynthesis
MSPRRVAYLSIDRGIPWGGANGASVRMAEMLRALVAEGADVLAMVAGIRRGATPPPPGVRVEPLPSPELGAALMARLLRRLDGFGAEVLYERLALHSPAAGSAAAAALGIPHLVELTAPLPQQARYGRLERREAAVRLEGTVLRDAALVLAVSTPLADYARARGARRVKVLPNAVAPDRFRSLAAPDGKEPVAVLAGALRPWHGTTTLAWAWRRLGSAAPPLLVVGDGPGRAPLERVGARITGWVPHESVPELLAMAQIGLAPYSAAAPAYLSPLKLFDYLAAGLAVVAASLPGVTEVLDSDSAVLVPPGDPRALADAVAELAADASRRARLGSAGRELALSRHTWRRRARDVLQAASELIELQAARSLAPDLGEVGG